MGMLFHPLAGSDPLTLASLLRSNGPIPARQWGRISLAAAASLGRGPFSAAERALVPLLRRRTPPMSPPIFIIGHWRSGTTHLYNLMAGTGRFGFVPPLATGLPWDALLLAQLLRPFLAHLLPEQRFIDRIPVRLDSPQEDEAALANMQSLSFYHGLYFPSRLREHFDAGVFFDRCTPDSIARWQRRFNHFLEKMHILNGGRRMLIKNPVYSARVAMLRDMLPRAKFIHIHRDPVTVFTSMRHFYFRLLEAMAMQDYSYEIVDELILESYPRMMRRLLAETAELPPNDFVELAYHELERQPLAAVERVYQTLDLHGFEEDQPALRTHLESVQGYKKNRHELPPELRTRVEREWAEFIERWRQPGAPSQSTSV